MNDSEQMRDRFRGCLMGLAVGDAMGMPVEILTRAQILEATGGRGVTGYLDPLQDKIRDNRALPAGTTTDDWQLAGAVSRSLTRSHRMDLRDQARELVAEKRRNIFGWGGTTRAAAEELEHWLHNNGTSLGRNPEVPAKNNGLGNGVAMKIAPLGLWHAVVSEGRGSGQLITDVMLLGMQTHGDRRASLAALAVAYAVKWAATDIIYKPAGDIRWLANMPNFITGVERFWDSKRTADRFSDTLNAALRVQWIEETPPEFSPPEGIPSNSMKSIPYAIAVYLRYQREEFERGILEAINAGGDTDTNAAMVGAMIGATVGLGGIPKAWVDGLRNRDEVLKTADDLYAAAIRAQGRGNPY